MGWGAKLYRVGTNEFRDDLDTGTITFDDSSDRMTATLQMDDGEAFFVFCWQENCETSSQGSRLGSPKAGRYRSAETGAIYQLAMDKGDLVLRSNRWGPALRLTPIAPDEFESEDHVTVLFRRDRKQHISGRSAFSIEARDIVFEKTD